MLTADTITDEQIRELRSCLLSDGHADTVYSADCHVALFGSGGARNEARARCAEILNARVLDAIAQPSFADEEVAEKIAAWLDAQGSVAARNFAVDIRRGEYKRAAKESR